MRPLTPAAGGRLSRLAALGRVPAVALAALLLAALLLSGASDAALGGPQGAWPSAGGPAGRPFTGVAAVGALFTETAGQLGEHFCTASVVHSASGDLALTAAHCVTGRTGPIAFVPGYANGREPFGVWQVTRVYADQAWQTAADPDHDIAFIRLAKAAGGVAVEDVTGGERLAAGRPPGSRVRVIGYPDGADQPVWCDNQARPFTATQLEFDCDGYPDGTSGGPFLADVDDASGQGTVIGVIGGYQLGGSTPDVSYSVEFGAAVAALYQGAQEAG
jgi:V8-like Glu-specific endopeptidase